MHSLLLKFKAPLQAWGAESRYKTRASNPEPTKSGVIGLLAAAQGRARQQPLADLAALSFAVRVDYPGQLLRDFHTARNWFSSKDQSQLSNRYYLSDAVFLVALAGEQSFLAELESSLLHPAFPLYLGRRSCPAGPDLVMGIRPGDAEQVLRAEKTWYAPAWVQRQQGPQVALPLIRDALAGEAGDTIRDLPLSFDPEYRQYGLRSVVRAEPVELVNPMGQQDEDLFFKEVRQA
ncbi:MAG: type I-E CRISPR-associated protein Cas5/CasD [Rothia sp. (in: high G+C Gram-positive bacteria)]|nr:type I-E CRISPR-associated protein Cas5/CasD [Rothia sp. (in: high G+C Gram-positive bacteria)]